LNNILPVLETILTKVKTQNVETEDVELKVIGSNAFDKLRAPPSTGSGNIHNPGNPI
jgi:hypothetical protein